MLRILQPILSIPGKAASTDRRREGSKAKSRSSKSAPWPPGMPGMRDKPLAGRRAQRKSMGFDSSDRKLGSGKKSG